MKRNIKNFTLLILLLCSQSSSSYALNALPFGHNILLIINYNFAHYNTIPILKELYAPWFPNIVFYGPRPFPGVRLCPNHEGWYAYMGIADAMQRYPNYAGYLQVHDDCVINCWNFTRFDKSKIWTIPSSTTELTPNSLTNWHWWDKDVGYAAALHFKSNLPTHYATMLEYNCGPNNVAWGYSDIVYFPQKYKNEVIELCNLARDHNLFLEITLPTFVSCLDVRENCEMISGKALWGEERDLVMEAYSEQLDFIHPMKLSQNENVLLIKEWYSNFCNV